MNEFRVPIAVFASLVLVAACSTIEPEAMASVPATTSTTTTTSVATTTSIPAPPMTVSGVPAPLARLVASIYEHAAGIGESPVEGRYLPEAGSAAGMAGRTAVGGTATLGEVDIGLVGAGDDLIGAVDLGNGWTVVATDLPTLGHRDLGYTSAVIAAVGSDARPGEDPQRARADSLHLIGFDGRAGTFDLVGIPRDSWVAIPGRGTGKITSSLAIGGPDTLRATLETLTGYQLDGMAITGFEGFQEALGNVLGGIQITLDTPMADSAAGASFSAGDQYMNGPQALAFARARKTLPRGDLDRQRNGGLVLIAGAFTARHRPVEAIPGMLAAASAWGWTDLDAITVLRLAVTLRVAPLLESQNTVLPGVPGERGGASTVELLSGASAILADLADGSLEG